MDEAFVLGLHGWRQS